VKGFIEERRWSFLGPRLEVMAGCIPAEGGDSFPGRCRG
jgi:hypothetical protein